jgi:hypothetical protein
MSQERTVKKKLTDAALRKAIAIGTNALRAEAVRRKVYPYNYEGAKPQVKRADCVTKWEVLAMRTALKYLKLD